MRKNCEPLVSGSRVGHGDDSADRTPSRRSRRRRCSPVRRSPVAVGSPHCSRKTPSRPAGDTSSGRRTPAGAKDSKEWTVQGARVRSRVMRHRPLRHPERVATVPLVGTPAGGGSDRAGSPATYSPASVSLGIGHPGSQALSRPDGVLGPVGGAATGIAGMPHAGQRRSRTRPPSRVGPVSRRTAHGPSMPSPAGGRSPTRRHDDRCPRVWAVVHLTRIYTRTGDGGADPAGRHVAHRQDGSAGGRVRRRRRGELRSSGCCWPPPSSPDRW